MSLITQYYNKTTRKNKLCNNSLTRNFLFTIVIDIMLTFPVFLWYNISFYMRQQNASRILAIAWASVDLSVCPFGHTLDLYQNHVS